ncbi:hypothetical protein LCGC14_1539870 [marine sediment metagenome]|uniref:Uncharacterized protein n=1 Tax=marine sediment metagenome TaxID=412755 RepID=A0A0F9ITG0_9ZZZZ
MADTPWTTKGSPFSKLYLQSGQFFSPVKFSINIQSKDQNPTGICWDGTNTPWCGTVSKKLFLQSGQFNSVVITSMISVSFDPWGISFDGIDTPWARRSGADTKLYVQSGQFTSAVKASRIISSKRPTGVSWDGSNSPWASDDSDKLLLQQGQFTSTILKSQDISSNDSLIVGISWDGVNTLWNGLTNRKLFLQSGQFTSTVKVSLTYLSVGVGEHGDISTNDYDARIAPFALFERLVSASLSLDHVIVKTFIRDRTLVDTLPLSQIIVQTRVFPRTLIDLFVPIQTISPVFILPDCTIKKHWPRWILASISKHFNDIVDTYNIPFFLEGTNRLVDDEKKFIECRIDAPDITQLNKNYYKLNTIINILWSFNQDNENFHETQRLIGIINNAMDDICIYRYGNDFIDNQELLGIMTLQGETQIDDFGQVRSDVRLMQGTVEGTYKMYINCS